MEFAMPVLRQLSGRVLRGGSGPVSISSVMDRAVKLEEMNRPGAALAKYMTVLNVDPLNVRAIKKATAICFKLPGNPRLSHIMERLSPASRLFPNDLRLVSDLGYAYYLSGRYELARKVFQSLSDNALTKEDPEFRSLVLSNLAYCLYSTGFSGKAAELVREAVEIDPENVQARVKLAEILGSKSFGKAAEAAEILEELEAEGHKSPWLYSARGQIALDNGDVEAAAEHFRSCVKLDPAEPRYHQDLANTLTLMDRNFRAARHYWSAFWLSKGSSAKIDNMTDLVVSVISGLRIIIKGETRTQ